MCVHALDELRKSDFMLVWSAGTIPGDHAVAVNAAQYYLELVWFKNSEGIPVDFDTLVKVKSTPNPFAL